MLGIATGVGVQASYLSTAAAESQVLGRRMTTDANSLLVLYLGSGDGGGYQPVGGKARVKEAFPRDHLEKMRMIAPYLDEDHRPDWERNDLVTEFRLFESELRRKFPELDALVTRALASKWAYEWR